MAFILTPEHIKAMLLGNKHAAEWHAPMVKIFDRFEINTPERIAMFIAQVGYESNNLTVLEENLNYCKDSMDKVFKKYFTKAGNDPKDYHRQPEKIANLVYADRMGNGDVASGDGWKFRGRGAIQLTGRENYTKFGQHKDVGRTPDEVIGYVGQKEGALASACWFWQTNNINEWADKGNIVKVTKIINGGENGLEDRKKHYEHALSILRGDQKAMQVGMAISTTVLREGDRGPLVKQMQIALVASEIPINDNEQFSCDGIWGPRTTRAVKTYQKAAGLTVDGIIGQVTMKALGMIALTKPGLEGAI